MPQKQLTMDDAPCVCVSESLFSTICFSDKTSAERFSRIEAVCRRKCLSLYLSLGAPINMTGDRQYASKCYKVISVIINSDFLHVMYDQEMTLTGRIVSQPLFSHRSQA